MACNSTGRLTTIYYLKITTCASQPFRRPHAECKLPKTSAINATSVLESSRFVDTTATTFEMHYKVRTRGRGIPARHAIRFGCCMHMCNVTQLGHGA